MRSIRRILVAVKDPRGRTLRAVSKAAQLARATGAYLELFHALSDVIYMDALQMAQQNVSEFKSRSRREVLQRLESIAAPLRRQGLSVQTSAEWDYPIYEAIVRRAIETKADLIVAELHATRRVAPWLLRFTDWELLRLSPVPVLLVKTSRGYHRPVILAAVDPSHAFSKPSQLDDELLREAQVLTEALGGALYAVHAYVPMPADLAAMKGLTRDISARIEEHARAAAEAGLKRVLQRTKIPRTRRHLVRLDPVDGIVKVAREVRSTVVVMGAISRSGLKRAFIGNTAERILDQLPCDLLVVKPPAFVGRVLPAKRGARLMTFPSPI
jgi:universal stress protein E